MTKQTNTLIIASIAIGALAWLDPLFIPLITLGPLVSGLIAGAYRVRPRLVAIPWVCGGLLMLVSDLVINHEDVAFHAVVAVFTALLAAGGAALTRRVRHARAVAVHQSTEGLTTSGT
jgi:hypothetical protein